MSKRNALRAQFMREPFDPVKVAISQAERMVAQGKVDQALDLLTEQLLKFPKRTDILLVIAKTLLGAERLSEAADTLTVLRSHMPNNGEVAKILGGVLSQMRQFGPAIQSLLVADRLQPRDGKTLLALAQSYEQSGQPEESAKWIRKAVEQSPSDVDLRCYGASVLHHAGLTDEAREILFENREFAQLPEVRLVEAMFFPIVNESVEEILRVREHYRQTLTDLLNTDVKLDRPDKKVQATNFLLGYHGLVDRDLIELSSKTFLHLFPEIGYTSLDLRREPLKGRKLKIGFVSSNMRRHSVGRVLNRFLEHLDRNRFHVVLFELPGKFDGGQEQARDRVDKVVFLPSDLESCRKLIEAEKPDALMFPDFVLEPKTDLLAYSRLAPVQCSTWGHPGTSGRPSMDYWISCVDWEPEGNDAFYTEKLVRFNSPPMIATQLQPPAEILSREALGLPEGTIYGCPQSLFKLHPSFDSFFAEILERDPNGYVVTIASAQAFWNERYRRRFSSAFPHVADRLIVLDHLTTDNYLSLLCHCAVSLDPIEFGGANTSMEAFTVGLPVVTWPGDQLRNRQTYSFYRMMNYMDLVVDSKEAYIEMALRLASDTEFRNEASRIVKERCHVIFDTIEVTRELENFFETSVSEALSRYSV